VSDLSKSSVIHKIYENKKNNNIYSSKNLLGIILFGVLNVTQLAGWAKAQSIQVAVSAFPTSMDPHFHTLTPNNGMASYIFDSLVGRDAHANLIPGLAESWRVVDRTTWEFKLRRGVRFHNGAIFDAEDVIYTINRVPNVPNSPSSFGVYTRAIETMDAPDPYTLRIRTRGPYPLLASDLSSIFIVSRSIAAASTTSDFNAGTAAIGTGPFRLAGYTHGDRAVFRRNNEYWGPKAPWEQVTYRFLANDGARVAALLSGDVDFIDDVPSGDVPRIGRDARFRVTSAVSLRLIFLALDTGRTGSSPQVTGPNGEQLDRNPLTDIRVRRALSMSINRQAITERLMAGAGIPANQMMPQATTGFASDIPPITFDANEAKRLLSEAGYPNGLSIVLSGANDRYINDAQIQQSIAQMWTRIGVRTRVDSTPYASFVVRAARFELSAFMMGWSNATGEPSPGYRALIASQDRERGWGLTNRGRYSNPLFDRTLLQSVSDMDTGRRDQATLELARIVAEDVPVIPLHHQVSRWAMRRNLNYAGRADETTLAAEIVPAN